MDISALREKIKKLPSLLNSDKRVFGAAILLGLLGIGMILFSENEEKDRTDVPDDSVISEKAWNEYGAAEEKRLESILSAVKGVGRVDVMITLGSTEEYIYAESENSDSDRKESEYVIIENQKGEEALVKKIVYPEITGVVVVCEGGYSDKIRERVYQTVKAALGISSNKIYVTQME